MDGAGTVRSPRGCSLTVLGIGVRSRDGGQWGGALGGAKETSGCPHPSPTLSTPTSPRPTPDPPSMLRPPAAPAAPARFPPPPRGAPHPCTSRHPTRAGSDPQPHDDGVGRGGTEHGRAPPLTPPAQVTSGAGSCSVPGRCNIGSRSPAARTPFWRSPCPFAHLLVVSLIKKTIVF